MWVRRHDQQIPGLGPVPVRRAARPFAWFHLLHPAAMRAGVSAISAVLSRLTRSCSWRYRIGCRSCARSPAEAGPNHGSWAPNCPWWRQVRVRGNKPDRSVHAHARVATRAPRRPPTIACGLLADRACLTHCTFRASRPAQHRATVGSGSGPRRFCPPSESAN